MGAIWYSYSVHLMNFHMTSLENPQQGKKKKRQQSFKATSSVCMQLGKTKIPQSLN